MVARRRVVKCRSATWHRRWTALPSWQTTGLTHQRGYSSGYGRLLDTHGMSLSGHSIQPTITGTVFPLFQECSELVGVVEDKKYRKEFVADIAILLIYVGT